MMTPDPRIPAAVRNATTLSGFRLVIAEVADVVIAQVVEARTRPPLKPPGDKA